MIVAACFDGAELQENSQESSESLATLFFSDLLPNRELPMQTKYEDHYA